MPAQRLTGSRIRERRLDRGLKQAAVADAVGISPSYLNLIEHNRRRIGGKLLGDLARVLGVDASLLTEGADSDLLDQMRTAAGLVGDMAEVARAEELAARFPGWTALIVAQARRLAALEEKVQALSDRLAYDPQLAASLHEVISAVTAIRSSSSILVGQEELDADWQRRFHENIHKDSVRLAASSETLIAYLEAPEPDPGGTLSPFEQVEEFLREIGFHVPELERPKPDVAGFLGTTGLDGPARTLLEAYCTQYAQDAVGLPLQAFQDASRDCQYDPAKLAGQFGSRLDAILRRLACLPGDADHPPMGLATCDASGALTFLKAVPGFSLPRTGGACPLWPLFGALGRPSQPVRAEVAMPGAGSTRFLCYAVAEPDTAPQFDALPILKSTMLVMPDPPQISAISQRVGVSCRICAWSDCPSRREPLMSGVTAAL